MFGRRGKDGKDEHESMYIMDQTLVSQSSNRVLEEPLSSPMTWKPATESRGRRSSGRGRASRVSSLSASNSPKPPQSSREGITGEGDGYTLQ